MDPEFASSELHSSCCVEEESDKKKEGGEKSIDSIAGLNPVILSNQNPIPNLNEIPAEFDANQKHEKSHV